MVFKNIILFFRLSRRFGAYTRFVKQGFSSDEARRMSDQLYPPTKEDLKYERTRSNKKPFPLFSTLSLLYPNIATYYFTKYNVTLLETLGYALTQLAYVLVVAILFGTFGILGLYTRKGIAICAGACFVIGFLLTNA